MICELCRHDKPQENRFCGMCGMPLEAAVFKSKSEPAYAAQADSSQSPAGGESTGPQGPNLPFENTAQSRPTRKLPEPIRPFWERHPVTSVVDEEPTPLIFSDFSAALSSAVASEGLAAGEAVCEAVLDCSSATAFEQPSRNASAPRSMAGSILGAWIAKTPKAEPRLRSPSLRRSAARRFWDSALNLMPAPTTCSKMKTLASPWVGYTVAVALILFATLAALKWHTEVKSQAQKNATSPQTAPSPSGSAATAAFPEPRARAARQEQRRAATPAEDDSMLLLAQKYLQGRGVPRDCGRGLTYLKEAVRRPSAHARSQMGALYATGTCVPQSRVEAYRWFSSALEIDPRNPWLARERDMLHGEMASFERQQVTR